MNIISLSPATTEILYAIGAGNMIVGNTYLCDYPLEAKKTTKVGSFSHVDMEKIQQLKPDIIFTSTVVQQRIYKDLTDAGLRVVHSDPRSIQDILVSIEQIGSLIGKQEDANRLMTSMKKQIQRLKETKPKVKPRVYVEEWYSPPMYSGNWVPELVALAGGAYGFGESGDISRETSEEAVLKFDPEYIFVSYCGFGVKSDPHKVLQRPGWANVSAVKNNNVFALNETVLNRPGPRILQSVTQMREYLYKII